MPSFEVYDNVYLETDIYVDEFLNECSEDDIKEIIRYLIDNNIISEDRKMDFANLSYDEEQLHKNLDKIKNNYYVLSNEDEETIKRIANKL